MRQQVRELSQVIQNDRFVTDSLRGLVADLQEKFDAATPQGLFTPPSLLISPFPSNCRTEILIRQPEFPRTKDHKERY